jgi:AraC-like DNA-binding protein
LRRAAELFAIDEWAADSRFVEKAWVTRSVAEPAFISVAASHWEVVVTTQNDCSQVTVRGPETRATVAEIPTDAGFLGIVFSLGTFTPAFPLSSMVDREVTLPAVSPGRVWLDGSRWEIPTVANVDVFVDRLIRRELVVRDPLVAEALQTANSALSRRTLQRRVARATGLTWSTIRQIERAGRAVELLGQGVPTPDAALRLGYADQPHLIRSLKRFMGQTPSQISRGVHWSPSSPLERGAADDR